ncbi:dihydrofolate reductase [Halobaculum magnesiiphilum]|uniref:dihydrofolate reductase n=1 Tax=Halobaculum magnesiiphilum TaxID=1017351 RepID=A0A8T8WEE2_9EURY|nr:dihydrofolate reductase [Halobaculum magnesiiphilum]QZP38094.1 dihydrofolate reductase [Halobaculum magnesiiphilum]
MPDGPGPTDGSPSAGADAGGDADGGGDIRVSLIAAVAANGVIGAEGGMPWHFPADMRHFKETTTGHPVIMGRRTYESIARDIGGPLPDRTNVVLSRSNPDLPEEVIVAGSVEEALAAARADAAERGVNTVYVAGGGAVYGQFLPLADELVLTEVHESYEGDTEFPEFDRGEWVEVDRGEHDAFDFVVYERRE